MAGFDRSTGEAHLAEAPLNVVLADLYPDLSLSEIARLLERAPQHATDILETFALPDRPETREVLKALAQSARRFQDWVSKRKMALRELQVLRLAAGQDWVPPVLEKIVALNATRAQGIEILELTDELAEMGRPVMPTDPGSPAEDWIKECRRRRFPVTTNSDQNHEERLKQIPWPAHTQVRWVRQGDRAGVEVKFCLQDSNDLKQQIQALNQVEQTGVLWPKLRT